jgi:hypothetical protein
MVINDREEKRLNGGSENGVGVMQIWGREHEGE